MRVVPATPPAPDLTAASYTGTSSTDNYTGDTTPTISVPGQTSGDTIDVTATKGGSTATCSFVADPNLARDNLRFFGEMYGLKGRDLKERIEANPAVLRAEVAGNRDETVEVVIDPMRMESYGLDALQTIAALTRSNRLVPAGSLDVGHGRFAIKVPGVFENIPDIMNMPV